MAKKTQKDIVLLKLREDGEITNIYAFEHHMLRLGAIIHSLRADGLEREGSYIEGTKNFQYRWVNRPKRIVRWEQLENNTVRPVYE